MVVGHVLWAAAVLLDRTTLHAKGTPAMQARSQHQATPQRVSAPRPTAHHRLPHSSPRDALRQGASHGTGGSRSSPGAQGFTAANICTSFTVDELRGPSRAGSTASAAETARCRAWAQATAMAQTA